ncbi:MAG: hypothetical protein ACRDZ4_00175 [Egibacteraceae bacterium]
MRTGRVGVYGQPHHGRVGDEVVVERLARARLPARERVWASRRW